MPNRNRSPRRRGFSLIELLIVIAIILIIITMAAPKFTQARKFANETSAVQSIKTINGVQYQYQSQFGKFATSLAELGPPQSGDPGPAASDLIPGDLAAGEKSGFRFTLSGSESGYVIHAAPATFGTTGNRTFYSDQTGVIRQNFGQEQATASSPEFK